MSFLNCAGKSKKKGSKKGNAPRDESPSYGIRKELPEDAAIVNRLTDRAKEYEETARKFEAELKDKKERIRVLEQEAQEMKNRLKAKVKEDSNKVSEAATTSSDKLTEEKASIAEELQSMKKDFETEKKKGEEEINRVSEELRKANKALETERNTGEAKLTKLENELKQAREAIDLEKNDRVKIEEEKEKCKREKDAAENTLAHTTKELEIAKKESHIPRSPTRAPSDEWKAKIETAEEELKKERDNRLEKERENSRLLNEKEELQNEVEKTKATKEDELENLRKDLEMNYKNDTQRLEQMVNDMKTALKEAEAGKEKLLLRLSTQTAAHVLDNNPNVSDLSDPNRPQKLGEQLSQIYDDQWTDATEGLEGLGKNEEEILQTLLDLLIAVYNHCKEAAESQIARIEEDLFLPPLENAPTNGADTNGTDQLKSPTSSKHSMSKIPRFTSHKGSRPALPNISTEKKTVDNDNTAAREKDKPKRSLSQSQVKGEKLPEIPTEIRKGIKEYRKKITKHVWPVIEKEVMTKLRKNDIFGESVTEACSKYISKCVEVCWLMRVQDPPVTLTWNVPDDRAFDSEIYRAYTKSGTHVEFVVWPAMHLHENGPLLMKGVAQGYKV